MGKPIDRSDNKRQRIKTMLLVAFGQKKMFQNILPAVLHFFIYAAFVITSTELFEIIFDGLTGNHRFFANSLGTFYVIVISTIEILSLLAFFATIVFLARRNLLKIPRFQKDEMTGWPKLDGNIILYLEILLIFCIFTMNGTDEVLLLLLLFTAGATLILPPPTMRSFVHSVARRTAASSLNVTRTAPIRVLIAVELLREC